MAETIKMTTPKEISEFNACVDAATKMAELKDKMFVGELQMLLNEPTFKQNTSVVLSKTHASIRNLIKKYNHEE